jgi:hypothetical protein
MPKISELNAITSVANNDLLMVVHDPSGLPSTNKITVNNFISSVGSQLRGYTGSVGAGYTGSAGVGGGLPAGATAGKILVANNTGNANWKYNPDVRALGAIYLTTDYTATIDDSVLLVVPATLYQPITITLPGNVPVGKVYTIRNIDSGNGQYPVIVNTTDNTGLIEDPHLGTQVSSYHIQYSGDTESWIHDGNYYRSLGGLSNSPVFLTSANSYHQVVLKNTSNANNASGDLVVYNDQGNYGEGTGPFIDMGINSSNYTDTTYGNVWGPNDAYLYNTGGDLVIGPQTDNTIKFVAGNTNAENVRMTVNSYGITVNSDIHSTTPYFDLYSINLAEMSSTTDGDGGGDDQAWMWTYQSTGYAEVGQYVQNAASYSNMYHYSNGTIQYYGTDNTLGINWNYQFRPHDNISLSIKPNNSWINELIIKPTGDYDIHLYEGGTGGAVTLGDYGATNFRVYGAGGANNGGGQYGNDIRAELYGNSSFSINSGTYTWAFESSGTLTLPAVPLNASPAISSIYSSSDISIQSNTNVWAFKEDGYFHIPAGGTLGPEGMGWSGLSNGPSGLPISVVYKTAASNTWQSAVTFTGGNDVDGIGQIQLYTYNVNTATNYQWTLESGNITLPANGDIKNSDGVSVIKSIPQNLQSGFNNYTLTLSDAGKHIYKNDGDGYGVEVPTDASVPFEIGTTITIVSGNGWTYIYPVDGMTTEVWGAGYNQTSTSFYIPNNSMATLLKIGTDKWMLSGAGLAID